MIERSSAILDVVAERITPRKMLLLLALGLLLPKLAAIMILDINSLIHPDIDVYVTTADELAQSGIAQTYAGYCYSYSHMFWFSVFLVPIVKVFGASYRALSIYLVCVSSLSVMLIYDTVRHVLSYKKAILIGGIICLLPSQILLPSYIVHEHALTFFLSLGIWLHYRLLPQIKNSSIRMSVHVLIWVTLLLASQVNSIGLVAIIAYCICCLTDTSRKRIKRLTSVGMVIAIVLIGSTAFDQIQLTHSSIADGYVNSDKVTWTLYVGSRVEEGWFEEAGRRYQAYEQGSSLEEIQNYRRDLLREEYMSLFKNPQRIVHIIKEKLITIWSCFTYPIGYSNETITNQDIRVFYNRYLFKPLVLIEFGISVLLVFCGLISRIRDKETNGFLLFLELYLLGVTALLLLTECNNKYTISMQMIFPITCVGMIAKRSRRPERTILD